MRSILLKLIRKISKSDNTFKNPFNKYFDLKFDQLFRNQLISESLLQNKILNVG